MVDQLSGDGSSAADDAAAPVAPPILSIVDAIYVVNLEYRTDRRAEMARELGRLGLGFEHPAVTLFPAERPEVAEPFPSIGARGCFLSHLGVLRAARAAGHRAILVLEDDADFTDRFVRLDAGDAATLAGADWDMIHWGWRAAEGGEVTPADGPLPAVGRIGPGTPIVCSHAIAFRASAIGALVPFLEAMLARSPGDPAGGPMHVDGAYFWFRKTNPERVALATREQWIVQRASRTDVHETGWKEKLPLIGFARRVRNRLLPR